MTYLQKENKMRKKVIAQQSLFDQSIHQLTVLVQRDKKLERISTVLDDNPQIVRRVHADLTSNISNTGACGMSAEQVLRVAILKQLKQYSYRELAERLNDGITLRWFTRFYSEPIAHFTTLQKVVKSIRSASWDHINAMLLEYARQRRVEKGRKLRADTTVVKNNIAYPTDARLLWDSIRVVTRIIKRVRKQLPQLELDFADRQRRCKKLCYQIVMVKGAKVKKHRRKLYRRLIKIANEVFDMACRCYNQMSGQHTAVSLSQYAQLDHYLTMMAVAIEQCERRVLHGEKVPACEKIVSIFEEHTDIIRRGKSQSPTEFGHKVLFATGKSGFITQYQVLRGNPDDGVFLPQLLTIHKQQFGRAPHSFCADRRFFSPDNESMAYSKGVEHVSMVKPGYRSKARRQLEKEQWFKKLQKFRAGIEGIISALMRGCGLKRCLWKGWKAFKRYVGLAVVTFNLKKIALLT